MGKKYNKIPTALAVSILIATMTHSAKAQSDNKNQHNNSITGLLSGILGSEDRGEGRDYRKNAEPKVKKEQNKKNEQHNTTYANGYANTPSGVVKITLPNVMPNVSSYKSGVLKSNGRHAGEEEEVTNKNTRGECDSTCDLENLGEVNKKNTKSSLGLERPVATQEYRDFPCAESGYPADYTGTVSGQRVVYIHKGEVYQIGEWNITNVACYPPPAPAPAPAPPSYSYWEPDPYSPPPAPSPQSYSPPADTGPAPVWTPPPSAPAEPAWVPAPPAPAPDIWVGTAPVWVESAGGDGSGSSGDGAAASSCGDSASCSADGGGGGGGGGGGDCFIGETKITLANGKSIRIDEIKVGQEVLSANGKRANKVVFIEILEATHWSQLYTPDVNISKPFVTINHPLIIDGQMLSPVPNNVRKLYPWLKNIELMKDTQMQQTNNTKVYNLWVTGDSTFQVNGWGTHSIAGDGGMLTKLYEKGMLSYEEVIQAASYFAQVPTDRRLGVKRVGDWMKRVPMSERLMKKMANSVNSSVEGQSGGFIGVSTRFVCTAIGWLEMVLDEIKSNSPKNECDDGFERVEDLFGPKANLISKDKPSLTSRQLEVLKFRA